MSEFVAHNDYSFQDIDKRDEDQAELENANKMRYHLQHFYQQLACVRSYRHLFGAYGAVGIPYQFSLIVNYLYEAETHKNEFDSLAFAVASSQIYNDVKINQL